MLNFSSLFAQNVVVTATRGATSDDKLAIMTSHGFQCCPLGLTRGLVHRIVVFIEYITVTSYCPRDAVSNHQPHDCILTIYSSADQIKHQSSASLSFVGGIHRSPVNSPHKGPVTRKCFQLMTSSWYHQYFFLLPASVYWRVILWPARTKSTSWSKMPSMSSSVAWRTGFLDTDSILVQNPDGTMPSVAGGISWSLQITRRKLDKSIRSFSSRRLFLQLQRLSYQVSPWRYYSLINECCYNADFLVTGGTVACLYDNLNYDAPRTTN